MSNEMYNAARRAVDDVLNTQFVRQGDLARKKFGNDRNATYRGVIEFSDRTSSKYRSVSTILNVPCVRPKKNRIKPSTGFAIASILSGAASLNATA